jgi:dTMP kinase
MPPPRFITFEGLDGSGKSTQLELAAAWLREQGIACTVTREPGGTALGQALRDLFLDHRFRGMDGRVETLLVFASRRQHLLEVIEPALERGDVVLCDRFTDSTRAYQGAGRGLPPALIEQADRLATGGRSPDRTLFFDLPPAVARARAVAAADRLDAEDLAFYERVHAGYRQLAAEFPERVRAIAADGEVAAVHAQVRRELADVAGDRA